MPIELSSTKSYAGRRVDAIVINTTLDQDAATILWKYAPPGRKATGKFLARLLYEHEAREKVRQELHCTK